MVAAAAESRFGTKNVNFATNARLNAVRDACTLPPEKRTEDDINNILHFASDVKFLQKLAESEVRALCQAMTLEKFATKDVIFKVGDEGDKFYIILTGSVSVLIPPAKECPNDIHPPGACTCPSRGEETVVALEKGQGFGELALQSHASTRSATVVANENTELLIVTHRNFDIHAGKLHRMYISQRVKFLRRFPKIEDALQRSVVSAKDIAAIANCLQERSLFGGELLARQGDPVECMTFVGSGQLAVLRLVDPDNLCEADGSPRAARPTAAAGATAVVPKEEDRWGHNPAKVAILQLGANLCKAMDAERRRPDEERPWWASRRLVQRLLAARKSGAMTMTSSTGGPVPSFLERRLHHSRGQELWHRLRAAFRHAHLLRSFSCKVNVVNAGQNEDDAGKRHVQQMMDVSAARRKFAEYRSRELTSHRRVKQVLGKRGEKPSHSPFMSEGAEGSLDSPAKQGPPAKKVLLRIGTISAFQYFGDRQVSHGEPYPVSLVGDPVAEVFTMSKYDIQRRFPKKLFSELFCPDNQSVPSDMQTLQLKRQDERWADFRKNLYEPQTAWVGRPLPFGTANRPRHRAAVLGPQENSVKFQVLGLQTTDDIVAEYIEPRAAGAAASLTPLDEIFYSQSQAAFLRKFEAMRADPELRTALVKAGRKNLRHGPVRSGGPAAPGTPTSRASSVAAPRGAGPKRSAADPNAFHFDLRWAQVENLSVGIDKQGDDMLEQVLGKRRQSIIPADSGSIGDQGSVNGDLDSPWQIPKNSGSEPLEVMRDATSIVGSVDLPPIPPRSAGGHSGGKGGVALAPTSARISGRKGR